MKNMVSLKIFFSRQQMDFLNAIKDESGISMSEHVRRAVDKYRQINQPGKVLGESKPGRGKV